MGGQQPQLVGEREKRTNDTIFGCLLSLVRQYSIAALQLSLGSRMVPTRPRANVRRQDNDSNVLGGMFCNICPLSLIPLARSYLFEQGDGRAGFTHERLVKFFDILCWHRRFGTSNSELVEPNRACTDRPNRSRARRPTL